MMIRITSLPSLILLVCLLSFTIGCGPSEKKFSSPAGSHMTTTIDDKLTITLGPASNVTCSTDQCTLEGEALFELKPGVTFTVKTANGIAKGESGTFRVESRRSTMNVSCISGKVKTSNIDGAAEKEIGGLEFVSYRGKNLANHAVKRFDQMTNSKYYFFDSESLLYVMECLEAQFGVKFNMEGINTNLNFSGMIPRDEMEIAFGIVFTPLRISYEEKPGEIILKNIQ
jgi:hypothetical protein